MLLLWSSQGVCRASFLYTKLFFFGIILLRVYYSMLVITILGHVWEDPYLPLKCKCPADGHIPPKQSSITKLI